jgi:dihydrofolate reductase
VEKRSLFPEGVGMAKVILGMTMSLDGFVNDRNGDVSRLYPDLEALRTTGFLQEVIQTTGAVVMGRHAFAMADDPDWFAGNYEFQVPIFVLTHAVPAKHPKETEPLKFSFVTDGIESAITQAKAAAGEKDVQVIGGASTFQQCLQAGLCDELHLGIMPVFLGDGLRLFEHLDAEHIQLEKIKVIDSPPERTDMLFRIRK